MLNLMGAALPKNVLGPQAGNEAGHWEPAKLLVLHDEFLATGGSAWNDWHRLDLEALTDAQTAEYQRRAREVIASEYGDAELLVLKDPRICRFVPLFAEVLGQLGLQVRYLIPIRHPAAVAASLGKRNGMSKEVSDLIYLRHVLDAEKSTRNADRLIVDYDELVADAGAVSNRLAAWLQGTRRDDEGSIGTAAKSVDPALRHEHGVSRNTNSPAEQAYHLMQGLSIQSSREYLAELDRLGAVLDWLTPLVDASLNSASSKVPTNDIPTEPVAIENRGPAQSLDEHEQVLFATQRQLSDTTAALAALQEHASALEKIAHELTVGNAGRLADSERRYRAAASRARAAEARAAKLAKEKGEAVFERDKAHEAINAMRRSLSWRISAPVRLVARLVRGETAAVRVGIGNVLRRFASWLPAPVRNLLRDIKLWFTGRVLGLSHSPANYRAIQNMVAERNSGVTSASATSDGMVAVDISAVVFNDKRWLQQFANSVAALDYPKHLLSLTFVDNGSTDGSKELLEAIAAQLRELGMTVSVLYRSNDGYGAGHNAGMAQGRADFVLVTNVDLEFEKDSISAIIAAAVSDTPQVAAWELRQLPFEHPKYYDPVIGLTNWNSHACVLLRRSAVTAVGGYDETIFMYGEDVELSYRLRREGHLLRYVPKATVHHYSFASIDDVKPLQFSGSTLSNFYLRLKYGTVSDMLAAPILLVGLALTPGLPKTLRSAAWSNVRKAPATAWRALSSRRKSTVSFPFRRWDFEMIRDGAGIKSKIVRKPELVSVITRTVKGREALLRQAVRSVANQTYGAIEHIIVQDGGSDMEVVLAGLPPREGLDVRFLGLEKVGRSAAGNAGLREATGRWCVFLDDDDLLFADHIEVLVGAAQQGHAKAAYSLAWEVPTVYESSGGTTSYEELSHVIPDAFRQDFDHDVLRHHNFLPIQSVLFERNLFEDRGGFEEDLDALEDWVLWNKYAVGNHFEFVKKTTSLYRVPASSESATQRIDVLTRAYPTAVSRIALNEQRYTADEED